MYVYNNVATNSVNRYNFENFRNDKIQICENIK